MFVACSDSEVTNNGGGGSSPSDTRDVADDRSLGDAAGTADTGGAPDASVSDAVPDEAQDVRADRSTDAAGDPSVAVDASLSDRDAPGNPGFDVGACVPTASSARQSVAALYFLLDSTTSMSMTDMQQAMTRWAALHQGISLFVDDVANDGRRIGVDFFPENADAGTLCAVSDYLMPTVPIAAVGPMSSQGAAISAALAARSPAGSGAVVPALTAALQHARDWAASQASLAPPIDVVLLVDGFPTSCTLNNNTMDGAVAAARAAAMGMPPVRTHVIGVGPDPGDWSQVAIAGGTTEAVYVAESTGVAIAAGLRTVRAKSASCELVLDGVTDTSFLNFEIRDADGGATLLRRAGSAAACGTASGWYIANPTQPKSATLCPTPCAALHAGASVTMLVGCRTVVLPP